MRYSFNMYLRVTKYFSNFFNHNIIDYLNIYFILNSIKSIFKTYIYVFNIKIKRYNDQKVNKYKYNINKNQIYRDFIPHTYAAQCI